MKQKIMKIAIPMVIIFVGLFMIFIFDPITTYASNTDDFWFGFNLLLKSNFLFLFISLLISLVISIVVIFINRKCKNDIVYNLFILFLIIVLVVSYIHGNYFTGKLPVLNGVNIVWSKYRMQSFISLLIVLMVSALFIFIIKEYRSKFYQITLYISGAIFIMLLSSLVTTLLTNEQIFIPKGVYTSTVKDINVLSKNRNFVVLVPDMSDSKTFNKVLTSNGNNDLLKDFTYFPDTLSAYGFTREAIPYFFSGIYYDAKKPFPEYYNDAFNNSKLIKKLNEKKYTVNIYEQNFYWNDPKSLEVNNVVAINYELHYYKFFKHQMKYILFKYLPYPLKKYSNIEWMDYTKCRRRNSSAPSPFSADNRALYDELNDIKLQNNNVFQFIHFQGSHHPWNINKNFEYVTDGTYEDKIDSGITVIKKYLDRLKKSGIYDDTIIIIVSDHGFNVFNYINKDGRQNPILYIKGINETHDKMQVSDKKVSFSDFNDSIYNDLLTDKKSNELLKNIKNNRQRKYMFYETYDEIHEQTLNGHAWETKKLKDTGKVYKR